MALNFGFGGGGGFGFFQSSRAEQGIRPQKIPDKSDDELQNIIIETKRIETASVIVAVDESGDFCDVQEAIDSLEGSGGHIFIKEGTFQSSASIKIPSNVTITGTGFNTLIERTTAGNVVINESGGSGNSNIEIKNLKVKGVNSGTYGGFYFDSCSSILLNSVYVENIYYSVYFEDCTKFLLVNSIATDSNISGGVYLEGCNFGSVLNNHLFGENVCISLDNSEHNVINGNQCNNAADISIEVWSDSHKNVISSNVCYNSANYAIYIAGDYNLVHGNICDSAFTYGIRIIGGANKNIVNENMATTSNSGSNTVLQDNISV